MESKIKSSFIPDKMPNTPKSTGTSSGAGASLFLVLAIIVFAVTASMAAGVYLYQKLLTTDAVTKRETLQRERKLLEPSTIKMLVSLDDQLKAADDVLLRHIAPSVLFDILEKLTLKSIVFNKLEYKIGKTGNIELALSGKALNVNGVALQSEIFGKNRVIINPIFSNLNLVQDGVEFDVTASIDMAAMRYVSTIEETYNSSDSGNL